MNALYLLPSPRALTPSQPLWAPETSSSFHGLLEPSGSRLMARSQARIVRWGELGRPSSAANSRGPCPSDDLYSPRPRRPSYNSRTRSLWNEQVKEAQSWLDLRDIMDLGPGSSGRRLNPAQLALLLKQLRVVGSHRQRSATKYADSEWREFLSKVAGAVHDELDQLAPNTAAAMLWTFAHFEFHPGEQWAMDLAKHLGSRLDDIDSISFCQVAWSLAKIEYTPEPDWLRPYFQKASVRLLRGDLSPQGIANLVWAAVSWDTDPGPEFMEAVFKASLDKLALLDARAMANLLWALAHLDAQPGTEWLDSMLAQVYNIASAKGRMHPTDVSQISWALVRLKLNRLHFTLPHGLLDLLVEQSVTGMQAFKAQELSNTLWSFVTLGVRPSDEWMQQWEQVALTKLTDFKAQELSNTVWSHAVLKSSPSEKFQQAFFRVSASKLGFFNPQDCANMIWSLGRLKLSPPVKWVEAMFEESFTQLPYFTTQNFANMLWGWSQLKSDLPQPWLDRFFLESYSRLPDFNVAELSALASCLCTLKQMKPPEQWMNQFLLATYSNMNSFRPRALYKLMRGLGRLRFKPNQAYLSALSGAVEFRSAELLQREAVLLAAGYQHLGQPQPPMLLQRLAEFEIFGSPLACMELKSGVPDWKTQELAFMDLHNSRRSDIIGQADPRSAELLGGLLRKLITYDPWLAIP